MRLKLPLIHIVTESRNYQGNLKTKNQESRIVGNAVWTSYFSKSNPERGAISFRSIDWTKIPKTEHMGETGIAYWQTIQYCGLRIRMVEYSKGNVADHWCEMGHFVQCLEGKFVSELKNGEKFILVKGMTYVVSHGMSIHRSFSKKRVKLVVKKIL